jgi:hypothetical protein
MNSDPQEDDANFDKQESKIESAKERKKQFQRTQKETIESLGSIVKRDEIQGSATKGSKSTFRISPDGLANITPTAYSLMMLAINPNQRTTKESRLKDGTLKTKTSGSINKISSASNIQEKAIAFTMNNLFEHLQGFTLDLIKTTKNYKSTYSARISMTWKSGPL